MAAKKLTPAQQRDRRAKIMLAVLGVVLVIVLGVQLPKFLGGSKNAADTTPPVTTPAAAAATPTAAALASAPTQLQHFTRFAAKDPFKAGYIPPAGDPSTTPTTTNPNDKQKSLTINVTQSPPPAAPTVPAALMMINGKKRVVALGATFPQKAPMFRIVALSQKSIWIELVAGSFPNGKQTLKIDRGRKVTLDNVTADLKFVLSLVKPTTAPAPAKKTS